MTTDTDPNNQQPITAKDVLRAIFLPEEETTKEAGTMHPLPSVRFPTEMLRPSQRFTQESASPPSRQPDLLDPAQVSYVNEPIETDDNADTRRVLTVGLGTLVTVLIAYLAQKALPGESGATTGNLLYAVAGLVWLVLLGFEFAPPDGGLLKRGPQLTGSTGWPLELSIDGLSANIRGMLALIAAPLSILTYLLTANNIFRPMALVTWGGSIVLWMLAVSARNPLTLLSDWRQSLREIGTTIKRVIQPRLLPTVVLLLIMGAAVFFRFYRLDAIPYQMTSDHVEKLLDAYDVSQGIHHVFFTRNGGREAIQFYAVAWAAKLFGTGMTFLTLKIVSVLEGLALIPLMVLFGREVVDGETGFYAAALVAISWWHVALSRLALRIVLTPLLFTLVLITLIRGIRTGQRKAWLWAGFWMGVGVYGYQSMRITPLVAVAAFVVAAAGPVTRAVMAHAKNAADAGTLRAAASNTLGRQALNMGLAGLVSLVIFVPMLRVWHDYPDQLWNRVVNRTTESERSIEGTPTEIFVDNYEDALGMFTKEGDVAWISAVPGAPMLSTVGGALFVLGLLAWSLRVAVRRDPADVFLIAAGMIMLLPSALAIAFPIENPSATRASGTLPIVFLLAAWTLTLIRQQWTKVMGRPLGPLLSGCLIAALLLGAGAFNFNAYFVRYNAAYRNAALNPGEVADAVREEIGPDGSMANVWLQGWPHWHDYRAIGIEAGDITFDNAIIDATVLADYLENYPGEFEARPLVFILHPSDDEARQLLEAHFPAGELQYYEADVPGREFYLFVVE